MDYFRREWAVLEYSTILIPCGEIIYDTFLGMI